MSSQKELLAKRQKAQKADAEWGKSKGGGGGGGGGEVRAGVSGAPTMKAALSGCTEAICAIVVSVKEMGGKKKLRALTCDIGDGEGQEITIVTAWDVTEGMRCVVAMVGSMVGDEEVKEESHGSVVSQGTLCSADMLGWAGGGDAAARLPVTFSAGEGAPEEKPKRGAAAVDACGNALGSAVGALSIDDSTIFVYKETKVEKKARLAAEKVAKAEAERIARGDPEPKRKLKPPAKKDRKAASAAAKAKRSGEDENANTDDELNAAGFSYDGQESDDEFTMS
jgi:tRNA-binding EMAP/Myf-like protein